VEGDADVCAGVRGSKAQHRTGPIAVPGRQPDRQQLHPAAKVASGMFLGRI